MSAPPEVVVYTDGACRGNPGPGGWGAVLISGGRRRELSGGEAETTNNRMELTAAIEALAALKRPCRVVLHTVSKYVMQGITERTPGVPPGASRSRTGISGRPSTARPRATR